MDDPHAGLAEELASVVARGDLVVPPYPAAAMRLQRLLASGRYGLSDVADAVSTDAALAAALLRIVNSAYYRPDGAPITAVGRAVHRLGMRSVASIAVAAGLGAGACAPGPLLDLKYAVWRRSVTCALLCQRLAEKRHVDAEEAFLCGLLHGFGRCVAVACLDKMLVGATNAKPLPRAEWLGLVERHRAALATLVAERWKLPTEVASVIGADTSNGATQSVTAGLLAIAERVASDLDLRGTVDFKAVPVDLRAEIDAAVHALPAALDALVQPESPVGAQRAAASAAVAKPGSAFSGELRPLTCAVTDLRVKRAADDSLDVTGIAKDGLKLASARPIQENSLIQLEIRFLPPVRAWFSVLLCMPAARGFHVEAQLFAADRSLRAEWAARWAAVLPATHETV